jgi:hypothetical protein
MLPLKTSTVIRNTEPAKPLAASDSNKSKNLKILIVEDDEINLMFLKVLLRKNAEIMLVARNGHEAISLLKNNPAIDLVLMDLKIPVLNGYETTAQMRQFNQDVVIIAQTAFAFEGDREKALLAGCDDYIAKPFRKEQLKMMIEKHLKQKNEGFRL